MRTGSCRKRVGDRLARFGVCAAILAAFAAPPLVCAGTNMGSPQTGTPAQFPPLPPPSAGPSDGWPPHSSAKQKQALLKSNFEKMKRDADELTQLAKALQGEISKSNQNVLSIKVLQDCEHIEKLAKQIHEAAKGF